MLQCLPLSPSRRPSGLTPERPSSHPPPPLLIHPCAPAHGASHDAPLVGLLGSSPPLLRRPLGGGGVIGTENVGIGGDSRSVVMYLPSLPPKHIPCTRHGVKALLCSSKAPRPRVEKSRISPRSSPPPPPRGNTILACQRHSNGLAANVLWWQPSTGGDAGAGRSDLPDHVFGGGTRGWHHMWRCIRCLRTLNFAVAVVCRLACPRESRVQTCYEHVGHQSTFRHREGTLQATSNTAPKNG